MRVPLCLTLAVALLAPARAEVLLLDGTRLQTALQSGPPCCVIDGRSEERRRRYPLPDALPYRAGLVIIPSAAVVVLADSDRRALEIAKALGKAHPGKAILAVKGGIGVWKPLVATLFADPVSGMPATYVIPQNTCEQAPPLQVLRRNPGK